MPIAITSYLTILGPDVLLIHEPPLRQMLPFLMEAAVHQPPSGSAHWQSWCEAQWAIGVRAASIGPRGLIPAQIATASHVTLPFLLNPVDRIPADWESVAITCPLSELEEGDPMAAVAARVTLNADACPFHAFRILGGVIRGRFPREVYLEVFNG